ncbi:MAG: hypothetical protein JNK64_17460 [Myxococcales bacterium]|nr:hypothetical protein [Myxococcales bacterium]
MRLLVAAAGVCLALAAAARPAAACSKRHQPVFELFELARDVAVVKVGAVPGPRAAGLVGLSVKQRLKGAARRLVARETNTSCHVGFRRGRTALVFIGADRWPAGDYEGYIERPSAALLATLAAWRDAATDADRAGVLVAAIDGAVATLRFDAALYLLDHPPLIAALTPDHVVALRRASQRGERDDATVLAILARQHGPAWRDVLAARPAPTLDQALQALADHDLEAITAAGTLADLIAQTPGEHAPLRIAAAERCERLHGKLLVEFSMYSVGRSDHGWQQLAVACRTGAPPRW